MSTVDESAALAYATDVLRRGPTLSQILVRSLDMGSGEFEATAGFNVLGDADWATSPDGLRENRFADPSEPGASRVDFVRTLQDRILPFLKTEDRLLLVESSDVHPTAVDHSNYPHAPSRVVQHPTESGYETYVLLPGPVSDPALVRPAMRLPAALHREVGVVVERAGAPLPVDGGTIDADLLRDLVRDVRLLFLRAASYDGYLIWNRDGRSV